MDESPPQDTTLALVALRSRKLFGWTIVLAGATLPCVQLLQRVLADPVLTAALQAGSVAALATALGTLPVLLSQRLSDRAQDTLLASAPASCWPPAPSRSSFLALPQRTQVAPGPGAQA